MRYYVAFDAPNNTKGSVILTLENAGWPLTVAELIQGLKHLEKMYAIEPGLLRITFIMPLAEGTGEYLFEAQGTVH